MIGGLFKSASRLAILAAAGVIAGGVAMPSAKAADLGGDCCADLEERVAELEATTARKGNRKVQLTVTGQVSRGILWFNDGVLSRTYAGLESRIEQTKFFFNGTARINPNVTAGFEFQVEIGLGATTSAVSNAINTTNGNVNGLNVDGNWGNDSILDVRTANWWIEDKHLGRVTVGRVNLGGPVVTIDLGGVNTGATSRPALQGGGFQFRNSATGALSGVSIAAVNGPVYGGDRIEGIQYDSPVLGGLLFRAVWGENDVVSASLRYAGEFNGLQVAAGIGFLHQSSAGQLDAGGVSTSGTTSPAVVGALQAGSTIARALTEWSGSLAFKHVPSGIFAQGHYAESDWDQLAGKPKSSFAMVQAGITKNWFGLGNTAFFGEYGHGKDQTIAAGFTSDADFWGLGINQKIDAAAMELFITYRHHSASVGVAGVSLDGVDLVYSGARIQF
jgi:hypothetical protein